jgi:acetylornithine deacetylase/succinyl-diaminopimelate desuccinylase-like protein
MLQAEGCLWEAGGVNWDGRPVVTLGLKGILFLELEVQGASRDVHSSYGGVVPNAAWRLAWALSSLKSRSGRVRIRGFYDRMRRPTPQELSMTRRLPDDDDQLRQSLGLDSFLGGARGFRFRRRYLLEPALNINGIESGYTGPGSKTIVPSVARAKIDFRLVPEQRPEEVVELLRRHLREHGFDDVQVKDTGSHSPPARTPPDSPWVRLSCQAAQEAYGQEPLLSPSMAGGGPMYYFTEVVGVPVTCTAGVSYPGNRIHAPNENIRLGDFRRGILDAAAVMELVGRGLP